MVVRSEVCGNVTVGGEAKSLLSGEPFVGQPFSSVQSLNRLGRRRSGGWGWISDDSAEISRDLHEIGRSRV